MEAGYSDTPAELTVFWSEIAGCFKVATSLQFRHPELRARLPSIHPEWGFQIFWQKIIVLSSVWAESRERLNYVI